MKSKIILTIAALFVAAGVMAGCGSAADTASKNISKDAEQFRVVRRIVAINGITDKVEFEVVGRCSVENGGVLGLEVTCKEGPGAYQKHFVGRADNLFYAVTQIGVSNVSEYRTKFNFRPESIVPDVDLITGEQG